MFSRWPYLAAVALIAAAVSDVLVEAVANSGRFGPTYLDTNDSSIVPSLLVAMLLAAGVIGGYVRAAVRSWQVCLRYRLATVAADVASGPPLRDVPKILGLQFVALFAMESVEQLVAHGDMPGGLLWLGGPPLLSIAAHIAVGIVCTLLARGLMRVSMPRVASLVCSALEMVLCARNLAGGAVFVVRRDAGSCNHAQTARVRHISGRAPPFRPLPA